MKERGILESMERKGKRMARRWCVRYGGEDEAGMSIDSGCTRLKPPFVAVPAATRERGCYSPLLLETVNPQSCWMLLLSLSLSMPRSLKLFEFRCARAHGWTG